MLTIEAIDAICLWYEGVKNDNQIAAFNEIYIRYPQQKQLYRACILKKEDIEVISTCDNVKVKTAPSVLQSWTTSIASAKRFSPSVEMPNSDQWGLVVIGALFDGRAIQGHTPALIKKFKEYKRKVQLSDDYKLNSTLLEVIKAIELLQTYLYEKEYIVKLDSPIVLNHLEYGTRRVDNENDVKWKRMAGFSA